MGSNSPEDLVWLEEQLADLGTEKQILTIPAGRHIYLAHWECSVSNGYLYISNGEVTDGTLTTASDVGYPFWTEEATFMPGSYQAVLDADCVEMPADTPAQLQATANGPDGLQILASVPLETDGSAALSLQLPAKTERVSFRVYQNDGTVLNDRAVELTRLS